jgi:hypothetical protein
MMATGLWMVNFTISGDTARFLVYLRTEREFLLFMLLVTKVSRIL